MTIINIKIVVGMYIMPSNGLVLVSDYGIGICICENFMFGDV
jgi:hypothetical protein